MGLFTVTWSLQVEKLLPPILRVGEFDVLSDDFLTAEPTNDYIYYIVGSTPGHWKEFPLLGVNLWKYLQSTESPQVIRREIQKHLEDDVFEGPSIDVSRFPTIRIEQLIFGND